jgi:divalent metal cation (Fe/Co/Zn/Cd) transporter
MRIACRIPKATDTHSEYVIGVAFTLQQWLHECASVLLDTYIACLVSYVILLNVLSVVC